MKFTEQATVKTHINHLKNYIKLLDLIIYECYIVFAREAVQKVLDATE